MQHGEWTACTARMLAQQYGPRGYDVLFDHGDKQTDPGDQLGKIVAYFGQLKHDTRLAFLDIAVVARDTDEALALVEIEESSTKPKLLVGDMVAALLGDGIAFQRSRDLEVGRHTTLIVLVHDPKAAKSAAIAYLSGQLERLKDALSTPNASMGRIVMGSFADEADLKRILFQTVENALSAGNA